MAFTVGCLCRPIKVAPLRNVDASEADNRLILSSSLHVRHSKRRTSINTPNHSFPPVRDTGLKRSTVSRSSRVVALIDGNPNQMAKQMERISAKEALILAIEDAGGVDALSNGTGNISAKIEVSEKVLALERLNPTPRPTTSPLLEGEWKFLWAGAQSPGLAAAKLLLGQFPEQVAALDFLFLDILQGGTQARASIRLFGSVQIGFTLTTRTVVQGPIRMKEEYVEGVISSPVVAEGRVPPALKGVVDQLGAAVSNLSEGMRESVGNGFKVSLAGMFERELLISYLDDELLVARDQSGVSDVLMRSQPPLLINLEGAYDTEISD